MNEVVEVIEQVRKEMGMPEDAEIRHTDDGRWLCADAYTFILASKKHQNIALWADMHQKMTDLSWKFVELGMPEKLSKQYEILKRCHKKPEVEIILQKNYGDVAVVVYTDSTYPILLEQMQMEGKTVIE